MSIKYKAYICANCGTLVDSMHMQTHLDFHGIGDAYGTAEELQAVFPDPAFELTISDKSE